MKSRSRLHWNLCTQNNIKLDAGLLLYIEVRISHSVQENSQLNFHFLLSKATYDTHTHTGRGNKFRWREIQSQEQSGGGFLDSLPFEQTPQLFYPGISRALAFLLPNHIGQKHMDYRMNLSLWKNWEPTIRRSCYRFKIAWVEDPILGTGLDE